MIGSMGRITELFEGARKAGHLIFYESQPEFKIEGQVKVLKL